MLVAGRYRLLEPLVGGAQGVSWRVEDLVYPERGEQVLKLAPSRGEGAQAILRAFGVLTRITGPHIAPIRDLGVIPPEALSALIDADATAPGVFLTRAFIEGAPADRWLSARQPDAETRCDAARRVGEALAEALVALHAEGVAHGDLKAGNVLVSGALTQPETALIDFGLAGLGPEEGFGVSGTPAAMAPELWLATRGSGSEDRRAADVYAWGVLMYTLASDRPPFVGEDVEALMRAHLAGQPRALGLSSPRLEGIISRAMAPAFRDRPSASEVLATMRALSGEQPRDARSTGEPPEGGRRPGPLPFLGRERALRALEARCLRPRVSVSSLTGPLGVGKSRLIEQLRWRLQRRGQMVFEVPAMQERGVWEGVRRLALQLASATGRALPPAPFEEDHNEADAQRLFAQTSRWLIELAPEEGATVIWDRFDEAGDDLQRWLLALVERQTSVDAPSPLRWVLASAHRPWRSLEIPREVAQRVTHDALEGLSWSEVEPWLRAQLQRSGGATVTGSLRALERWLERVGGNPMLFEAALRDQLSEDGGSVDDPLTLLLQRAMRLPAATRAVAAALASLGAEADRAALTSVLAEATPDLTTTLDHLEHLRQAQLVSSLDPVGRRWRLRWPVLERRLHDALEAPVSAAIARAAARWLEAWEPTRQARIFTLLLQCCERIGADAALREEINARWKTVVETLTAQQAHGRVVDVLTRMISSPGEWESRAEVVSRLCDAAIACGRGVEVVEALERRAIDDASAQIDLARVLHGLGRLEEAAATLDALTHGAEETPTTLGGIERVRWLLWRAQIALRTGPYERAARWAETGIEVAASLVETPALRTQRGRLEMVLGAALIFQGEATHGLARLDEAQRLLMGAERHGEDRARLQTFRAIGSSQKGDIEGAAQAYQRALEEAERAGLEAALPIYLLNLGTAHHRLGRLGLAREYYSRGTHVSVPSTRPSTRALLLANQANIDVTLGRVEEARGLLGAAREQVQAHALPLVEVFITQLLADADALEGRSAQAYEAYLEVSERYAAQDDRQHRAEVLLKAAEVSLAAQRPERAWRHLEEARQLCERGGFADLRAHLEVLTARWMLTSESAGALMSIERFRRGLEQAAARADHLMILRQAPHLILHLEREGMRELIDQIRDQVRAAWQAIAAGLNRSLRRDFMTLLERQGIAALLEPAEAPPSPTTHLSTQPSSGFAAADLEPFYRLLSLNARIINEPSLSKLLPAAMDIALALSGAERGFLLLRDTSSGRVGDFKVAISRDVDGEPIQRPHLKVSLTIAREVAERGEQILTVNAQNDDRFNEALSVHRLELTSVLCVPVRDREEVLGTLYLDHRFRLEAFSGEAPRMMRAFADQLALALRGARRLRELEAERAAHERARRQVEALLAEKEALLSELKSRYDALSREVEQKDAALKRRYQYDNIIASSEPMQRVFDQLDRVVDSLIPVLILGESGTGKELVARAIHFNSSRASKPFVAFNCGAVSESLSESELFGHIRGAFTGADRPRDGLFVAADGGTLFLDELGEMSPSVQVKLLRAIQERRIRPVGATQEREVDARLVAATNRDLQAMVAEGTFREDLYWRLSAFALDLPALRERREDIPLLARHFLERFAQEEGLPRRELDADAMTHLYHAGWPGNVRQFENVLRTACVLATGPVITLDVVAGLVNPSGSPSPFTAQRTPRAHGSARSPSRRGRKPKATRPQIIEALREAGDDRGEAARLLGVSERTLYRYINRFGLD